MEVYQGRGEAVLIAASEVMPGDTLDDAQRLVDHGEPSEGLLQLAWAISNSRAHVPSWIVPSIRELSADLVAPETFPEDLDDFAV